MFNFENGVTPINDTNLNLMQVELLKIMFPIGSRYITQDNINPSSILGFGTWERSKGRVYVGLDEEDVNFNSIGKKGGEVSHKLTVDEIPSHSHTMPNVARFDENGGFTGNGTFQPLNLQQTTTNPIGGGEAHNNLQPYEVVGYMWIRRS